MKILGINAFFHDSSAALLVDGEVVAAALEERFTRIKHDSSFPWRATEYCLGEAGLSIDDIDYVCYFEKPFIKFERIIKSSLLTWPFGLKMFPEILTTWLAHKINIPRVLKKKLGYKGRVLFANHHLSHAASSFYTSPFKESTILTVDGVGEWTTTTVSIGQGNIITPLKEIHFPHSLGLLYSAFTYYLGFQVNDGEYKVMGLAPYGKPRFEKSIEEHFLNHHDDGSFSLKTENLYFDDTGRLLNHKMFENIFGFKRRDSNDAITSDHKDLASSIQKVTERLLFHLSKFAIELTGNANLCLSGGVALNCVANNKLLHELTEHIYVPPFPGDGGNAIGAALWAWYQHLEKERTPKPFNHNNFGPHFSNKKITKLLDEEGIPFNNLSEEDLLNKVSSLIDAQKIVGWFQGRMEFGPRALGNRSILADARNIENWKKVNLKIKFRESFRPFAPSALKEIASHYFELKENTNYSFMQFAVNSKNSSLPATTHLDGTSRIQMVSAENNPRYHRLLHAFKSKTGTGAIINTSFNLAGEPIVCTPEDALRVFKLTEMDALVLENCLILKSDMT